MSDRREPTLGGVLAAVQALDAKVALREDVEALQGGLVVLRTDLDKTKFDLMERIDRLQDKLTEQVGDSDVLLEVLATNQKLAERSLSEARLAVDQYGPLARAITIMERQIRELQEAVSELRGKQ